MKKQTFINLSICITAGSIIFYYLYSRFSKKRIFIDLNIDNIQKYHEHFSWVISFSVFMLLLTIITGGLSYYYKNRKTEKESLLNKFANKLAEIFDYLNIFYRAYVIIFSATNPIYLQYIVKLAKFCLDFKRITIYTIIVLFIVWPRLLILSIFLTEIHLGQLYLYFFSLLLSIIPLIFRIILFMLKDVGPRVLPELKKFIFQRDINMNETVECETSEGIKHFVVVNFYLAPGYEDLDLDAIMENAYKPCLFIENYIKQNNPVVFIISTITRIIYYSITAIGFAYIIY